MPFNRDGRRRLSAPVIEVPERLSFTPAPVMSTQQGFGLVLNEIARGDSELAARIVTASPDVTVSTNLGAWVNRRGLFARAEKADLFRSEKIPSTFNWDFSPKGQHIELGIAEMNLFILMSALGLSHQINGERLLPIATLYDPFIERGLDALNYACYQDARFMVAATPSGITLAPEGGAHQSIATPLIGMAQDGLASFEPAFVDELAVIMGWGFAHMQREGGEGGSVYLRLSTRSIEQPQRIDDAGSAKGHHRRRLLAAQARAELRRRGRLYRHGRARGDRGHRPDRRKPARRRPAGDHLRRPAACGLDRRAKAAPRPPRRATSQPYRKLLAPLPRDCGIVTVIDGHPATLGWLGSVRGHRVEALGVEHFGQTGTICDLYRHYGIDANAIIDAAESLDRRRPGPAPQDGGVSSSRPRRKPGPITTAAYLLQKASACVPRGVWVPAFAGTTAREPALHPSHH